MTTGRKRRSGCPEFCTCWRCTTRVLGNWLDDLGTRTCVGRWLLFVTITYRSTEYGSVRGLGASGTGRPSSAFARYVFHLFSDYVERCVGAPIDYVIADQYGSRAGRFHQHALVAGRGLERCPRRDLENWLLRNAGYSRVLPFARGAAYYVGRFIGREAPGLEWDLRISGETENRSRSVDVGRTVVAKSADLPSDLFHQTFRHYGRSK
jgi:hypothetical protein